MDSEYKTLRSLLGFLQHNDGSSGVVIEADVVKTIVLELRLILGLHEVQQGEQI
jgi:hypothetical protein